jgi:hypothetical protein
VDADFVAGFGFGAFPFDQVLALQLLRRRTARDFDSRLGFGRFGRRGARGFAAAAGRSRVVAATAAGNRQPGAEENGQKKPRKIRRS